MPTSHVVHTTQPNGHGKSFAVRLVLEGGDYGLNLCLTNNKPEPLIEFYDTEFAGKKGFTEHGQFVSRYCLSTLLGVDEWGWKNSSRGGVDLCGHVVPWYVEQEQLRLVLQATVLWLGREAALTPETWCPGDKLGGTCPGLESGVNSDCPKWAAGGEA